MKSKIYSFVILICLSVSIAAQTGGPYDLSHNVIAGGGGSQSTGGAFTVSGTTGQSSAGTLSSGGAFNLRSGFWAFNVTAPTAAGVFVSGQVINANGEGINRVMVYLTDTFTGLTRSTNTNEKGEFIFEDLEVLHFYIISAKTKLYTFFPDSYSFELISDATKIIFTGTLRQDPELPQKE